MPNNKMHKYINCGVLNGHMVMKMSELELHRASQRNLRNICSERSRTQRKK